MTCTYKMSNFTTMLIIFDFEMFFSGCQSCNSIQTGALSILNQHLKMNQTQIKLPDLRSGLWIPASLVSWPGNDEVRCCWTFTPIFNSPFGSSGGCLSLIRPTPECQDKHAVAWHSSISVGMTGIRPATHHSVPCESTEVRVHSGPHFLSQLKVRPVPSTVLESYYLLETAWLWLQEWEGMVLIKILSHEVMRSELRYSLLSFPVFLFFLLFILVKSRWFKLTLTHEHKSMFVFPETESDAFFKNIIAKIPKSTLKINAFETADTRYYEDSFLVLFYLLYFLFSIIEVFLIVKLLLIT